MSSTDAITLPPVSMADLDVVAALVAAVGWPHRRADIAALIELGRGRLAWLGRLAAGFPILDPASN
jgi:hypothetical protein